MKIACWSGPRNISTAMMYSFANRADCGAVDEPFYAAYLAMTGRVHPMGEAILASQPTDPDVVIAELTGPNPGRLPHVYHKHMAQHMLPGIRRDWFTGMKHILLIRHPARVVASFSAKYENPELAEIGFTQQAELYDQLTAEGHAPVVLDSADVRADPEGTLRALCEALGLDWDPAMLHWPAGPKAEDGVWAAHWYNAVHGSTGFAGAEGPMPVLEGAGRTLAEAALPSYEKLTPLRLRA
ncbi:sulfotransferase [Pseudooceanicola nanhaiensis]|uniref:sulfotransferase n=1 Tax=Pseudooceanicola nanhaiensis TaxID=375761 RepID=UPI001CD59D21|nr:sulfotransferase [Pseudooceanicola nanhaiensis]MCA0920289.1 sulfotransferase [Pseudooceanicola nanhaiensis]